MAEGVSFCTQCGKPVNWEQQNTSVDTDFQPAQATVPTQVYEEVRVEKSVLPPVVAAQAAELSKETYREPAKKKSKLLAVLGGIALVALDSVQVLYPDAYIKYSGEYVGF